VKVTLVRGGGIAGAVVTVSLDSSALDDAGTDDLRRRIEACSFTDREAGSGADRRRAELTVSDHAGTSVVRFDEGDAPDGVSDLVAWLLDQPAAERSLGR
jgi:hypothetical protein